MAVAREIKSAGGVDVLAIDSGGLQSADWLYELQGTAKYAVGTEGDNVVYGYSYLPRILLLSIQCHTSDIDRGFFHLF